MFKLNNKSKKIMKALSLGIVSFGLLVGIGTSVNSINNVHAATDDEIMNQELAQAVNNNVNFNKNAENDYIQTTLSLKNDKNYPIDVVETLNNYPDLEHSAIMNKMIGYLSPQGREKFNEYYFNNSSTGAGLHLKESSDAAAGLDYDPHNSADNYLPLVGQHYISTADEQKMQNPPLFSSSSDDNNKPSKQATIVKPKKANKKSTHRVIIVRHHHARRHDKNIARNKKAVRVSRKVRRGKKAKQAKIVGRNFFKYNKKSHKHYSHKRYVRLNNKDRKSNVDLKHKKNIKRNKRAKAKNKKNNLTKKQVNHFNGLLKKDDKDLKSKKAKYSYKYRRALLKKNQLIKKLLRTKK